MITRLLLFVFLLTLNISGAYADNKDELNSELDKNESEILDFFSKAESEKVKSESSSDKKIPIEDSFIGKYLNSAMKDAVKKLLKDNPFSKMSEEEVSSMIKVRFEGKAFGKMMEEKPGILKGMTAWIRDKKAVPSLFGVLNRPDKVKKYSIVFFIVFGISFLLGLRNSGNGFMKRLFYKVLITITAMGINLTAFFIIFREEVGPTVKIVLDHL